MYNNVYLCDRVLCDDAMYNVHTYAVRCFGEKMEIKLINMPLENEGRDMVVI